MLGEIRHAAAESRDPKDVKTGNRPEDIIRAVMLLRAPGEFAPDDHNVRVPVFDFEGQVCPGEPHTKLGARLPYFPVVHVKCTREA